MTFTEDEARKKWCPFARYASSRGDGINRWVADHDQQLNPDPAHCIGSACMAWRWGRDEKGDTAYKVTPVAGTPGHFDNAPMGFCGLAGRPA